MCAAAPGTEEDARPGTGAPRSDGDAKAAALVFLQEEVLLFFSDSTNRQSEPNLCAIERRIEGKKLEYLIVGETS
jgi:hypothetical protein